MKRESMSMGRRRGGRLRDTAPPYCANAIRAHAAGKELFETAELDPKSFAELLLISAAATSEGNVGDEGMRMLSVLAFCQCGWTTGTFAKEVERRMTCVSVLRRRTDPPRALNNLST